MVNDTDLTEVITSFQQNIADIKAHTDLCLNLYENADNPDRPTMDLKNAQHIYENSLLSAVVAWHSFASDWVLTAIACDCSVLSAQCSVLNNKLQEAQAAAFRVTKQLTVYSGPQKIRRNPSISEVRDLIEGPKRGSNLRLYGLEDWQVFRNVLGAEYAARIDKFSKDDDTVMRLCNLMRDVAAHKSDKSWEKFNAELRKESVANVIENEKVRLKYERKRVSNLGEYLFAYMTHRNPGQSVRLGYFLYRLTELSEKLR